MPLAGTVLPATIVVMDDAAAAYEVRYGWNRRTVTWASVFLFLAVSPLVPGGPVWAQAILGAAGLVCLALTALPAFSRPVAFRAGPEGVTLGGTPFGLRAERFGWPDVASVELWTESAGRFGRMPYIGVRHRAGAAARWGRPDSPAVRLLDEYLARQVAPEFVRAFQGTVLARRGMGLWRVERSRQYRL
ncbi:hypothetical protein [Streptomyces sp. NPDC001978]|uniref:hypothetical protein n=1 Tax=Streptomyces sp. NPDC001978 TaxID=3364627 RepID=UPI003694C6C2